MGTDCDDFGPWMPSGAVKWWLILVLGRWIKYWKFQIRPSKWGRGSGREKGVVWGKGGRVMGANCDACGPWLPSGAESRGAVALQSAFDGRAFDWESGW